MLINITAGFIVLFVVVYFYTAWTYHMVQIQLEKFGPVMKQILNDEKIPQKTRSFVTAGYLMSVSPWGFFGMLRIMFKVLTIMGQNAKSTTSNAKSDTSSKSDGEYSDFVLLGRVGVKYFLPINIVANPLAYLIASPFICAYIVFLAVRNRFRPDLLFDSLSTKPSQKSQAHA